MSQPLLKQDILFYQRFLKSIGLYKKDLDGEWGKYTNKADVQFTGMSQAIATDLGTFDVRSEMNIFTLVPKAQTAARKFLKILTDAGKDVRIISGTRTYAEQDMLYRKGRFGNPGPKVTNAKGGQSNHNFGIAWDIGLFKSGTYVTDDNPYIKLAPLVLPQIDDLEWGGNWITFPDYPHYQLKAVSDSVATIRGLFENGEVYA
jgi:peptidoglycan L-alanyl-D-glutamate endopeptidase CwlK